jgi:outer membrane protein assembly factor BamB
MQQRSWQQCLAWAAGGLLVTGGLAFADNWGRFRGPQGLGISGDRDVPVRWNARENLLWQAALPGVGHSSPVVWGEHVFLQSASADGKERWLLCLDAATGKLHWSRSAPGGRGRTHQRNTPASSTPAADGERVYAVFWDGKGLNLCAYDFKGGRVWQRDLGPFRSQHGPGLSPVVARGKVILADDQDGSAVVLAFDGRTGRKVWQAERKAFRACYSTPLVLDSPGEGTDLVVASTAGLTSYDPDSGAVRWHFTWTFPGMPLRTVGSPVATAGLVFATSGDGRGDRDMIAVKRGGQGDVTGTHLAWQDRRHFPYVPSLLAWEGRVYAVTDQGVASCHEAETGKEVWTRRLGRPVSASPVLVNGIIYAPAEDGTVYVFKAADTFQLLARNRVGEPVFASPAVANNRLFIRGQQHLFCIARTRAEARREE